MEKIENRHEELKDQTKVSRRLDKRPPEQQRNVKARVKLITTIITVLSELFSETIAKVANISAYWTYCNETEADWVDDLSPAGRRTFWRTQLTMFKPPTIAEIKEDLLNELKMILPQGMKDARQLVALSIECETMLREKWAREPRPPTRTRKQRRFPERYTPCRKPYEAWLEFKKGTFSITGLGTKPRKGKGSRTPFGLLFTPAEVEEVEPKPTSAPAKPTWVVAAESAGDFYKKLNQLDELRARAARAMAQFKVESIAHIKKVNKERGCHIRTRHLLNGRKADCPYCDHAVNNGNKSKALKTPLYWNSKEQRVIPPINRKPAKIKKRNFDEKDVEGYTPMTRREMNEAKREWTKSTESKITKDSIESRMKDNISRGMALLTKLAEEEPEDPTPEKKKRAKLVTTRSSLDANPKDWLLDKRDSA